MSLLGSIALALLVSTALVGVVVGVFWIINPPRK